LRLKKRRTVKLFSAWWDVPQTLTRKPGRIINQRSRLELLGAGVGAPLVAPKRSEAALTKATISPVKCWAQPSRPTFNHRSVIHW
jgi:hypothetical protein